MQGAERVIVVPISPWARLLLQNIQNKFLPSFLPPLLPQMQAGLTGSASLIKVLKELFPVGTQEAGAGGENSNTMEASRQL